MLYLWDMVSYALCTIHTQYVIFKTIVQTTLIAYLEGYIRTFCNLSFPNYTVSSCRGGNLLGATKVDLRHMYCITVVSTLKLCFYCPTNCFYLTYLSVSYTKSCQIHLSQTYSWVWDILGDVMQWTLVWMMLFILY